MIYVLENAGRDSTSVKMIETQREDDASIKNSLTKSIEGYKDNTIEFDGSYKPENDESLVIKNFDLPNEITEAINNPLGVTQVSVNSDNELDLKAIFVPISDYDDCEKIIFQRLPNRQILKSHNFTLFFNKHTFSCENKPGIVITDCIDAYYEYGNLYFKSYYWANQIFNLNKYYREATTDDIKKFCSNECFSIDDIDSVAESCNNWTRRKIAYILDSGVLENNSVDEIIKSAKKLNLKIDINEENKIIFPDDKDSQKELLSYLPDEIYRRNLTDGVYLTNSKRPL